MVLHGIWLILTPVHISFAFPIFAFWLCDDKVDEGRRSRSTCEGGWRANWGGRIGGEAVVRVVRRVDLKYINEMKTELRITKTTHDSQTEILDLNGHK